MKKIISSVLLFLVCVLSGAQNVYVEAPRVVTADEPFTITFNVDSDITPSDFQWDVGPDFRISWGPQTGSSTTVSIIQGKYTKKTQYSYSYLLTPKKAGKFNIPTASVTIKGKQYFSNSFMIEVLASDNVPDNNNSEPRSNQKSKDELYMKLILGSNDVYIGQPVTAVLKLFTNTDIAGFENFKFPVFQGIWNKETYSPTNISFERENVNGKIMNTTVLKRYSLIPQQAGTIKIAPAELVCIIYSSNPSRGLSILDSFFEDNVSTARKRVVSSPVTLNVKPLPGNAPESFNGAVGKNFTIKGSVSSSSIKSNEAGTLSLKITGEGNMSLLELPKVSFPSSFEVYDAKVSDKTDAGSGGTKGSKVFEIPFIPRGTGKYEIPKVDFTYFDVSSGKYHTISTGEFDIEVEKGNAVTEESESVSMPQRKGVKTIGEDIRFIDTGGASLSEGIKYFVLSPLYMVLVLVFVSAFALVVFRIKYSRKKNSDVAALRTSRASKVARKRLMKAKRFLDQSMPHEFYEELYKALLGYVSDKWNLKIEDMSKDNMENILNKYVPENMTGDYIDLLNSCEYSRYTPNINLDSMNGDYEKAVSLLTGLNEFVSKGKKKASHLLMAVFLLLLPFASSGAAVTHSDSLWNKGKEEYKKGNWEIASENWKKIEDAGLSSPSLFYNMGNAYFKQEKYSKAILYWERCLKIDPSHKDAAYNLELSNDFIKDNIQPVPEFVLKTIFKKICYLLKSDTWAILSLLSFAMFLVGMAFFLLSYDKKIKKTGFYSSLLVSFPLFVILLIFAQWQKMDFYLEKKAVIMKDAVPVKSSPADKAAKDLFILHEGTKVDILDESGGCYKISLADGRQGWIIFDAAEII